MADKTIYVNTLQPHALVNGVYIGLEEMCYIDSTGKKDCYTDPSKPKWKWYHLGYLKIRGDSVFLDQSPICIYKKDTSFSASDGGFHYFSGTVQNTDTGLVFKLRQIYCDYCGVRIITKPDGTREIVKRTKHWVGRLTNKGIIINGQLYTRTTARETLRSEDPKRWRR